MWVVCKIAIGRQLLLQSSFSRGLFNADRVPGCSCRGSLQLSSSCVDWRFGWRQALSGTRTLICCSSCAACTCSCCSCGMTRNVGLRMPEFIHKTHLACSRTKKQRLLGAESGLAPDRARREYEDTPASLQEVIRACLRSAPRSGQGAALRQRRRQQSTCRRGVPLPPQQGAVAPQREAGAAASAQQGAVPQQQEVAAVPQAAAAPLPRPAARLFPSMAARLEAAEPPPRVHCPPVSRC